MKIKAFLKNYLNYAVIAAVAIVAFVIFSTASSNSTYMQEQLLLEKMAIAIILAVSLNMVVGFLGELSLGHAGFMCAGAYLGGKLASVLEPMLGNGLLPFFVCVLSGGLIAAILGIIVGLPALRLRGDYLAIVTLAFGEIVRTVFMNLPSELFGGTLGLPTPRFNRKYLFLLAFAFVLLCLMVIQNLMRSKHGRAITAIRDNEIAARATGINITKYKLFVFTVSAFFAGVAGVLFSYANNTIQSAKFDYNYSIEILVMVVLGGLGNINGSIIAAALITYVNITLQTHLPGDLAVLQNILYALLLIGIVIYKNAPALKGFREKYSLASFKKRRKEKMNRGNE